jgi:hypothetical protein
MAVTPSDHISDKERKEKMGKRRKEGREKRKECIREK